MQYRNIVRNFNNNPVGNGFSSGLLNIGNTPWGGFGYAGNTLEAFLLNRKLGFNSIKCDIRVSSDGEFILCHDRGFTCTNDTVR